MPSASVAPKYYGLMSMTWTQVTPRVFVTRLEPHRVNSTLVIGDVEAALIDTGNTAEQGAELLASAAQQAGVPVRHVIITHAHEDHFGGLAGMGDIESIAHENLTQVQVSRTFSMALAIDLGNQRVEVVNFGNAHTTSDAVIFLPGEDLVVVGDLLEEGADIQVDETTSLSNWPTYLDGVLGAVKPTTRFIPGHGDVVDRDFAFIARAEIAMLYGQCEMLINQGTPLEEAASSTEWPFTAETLAVALPKAYAELAAAGITPKKQLPIMGI